MVRPKKAPTKKQKPGSIDFKKIKRKIGRKLPPPKNSTNTEIKSKAIILPEQSIVSERAGLAVSSKGLTLRELLQQTSHHNAKNRKFALLGIRDLLSKNPAELTLHKLAIIEKLRERICDSDKVVRDTLYHLLKTTVFPASKEDVSIVSLMMGYVFNAMTHLALDVRLTAFNFFDLIVTCYPFSFFLYAEKVIDNYKDILQNNQIYMQNRSKVKSAISGLVSCLCLLFSDKDKADPSHVKENFAQRTLHVFGYETPKDPRNIHSIFGKLEELMPILVSCFLEFALNNHAAAAIDAISFDCMLNILQCIKLAARFLLAELDHSHSSFGGTVSTKSRKPDAMKKIICVLEKLSQSFPFRSIHQLTEKEDERYFVLNIRVSEIYLHLTEGNSGTVVLMERFLDFLENSLYVQDCGDWKIHRAFQEKHLISIMPLIPEIVMHVTGDWRTRFLKAFTSLFQDCKVESKLNLACLSAIEKMLLSIMHSSNSFGEEMLDHQAAWLKKLPWILLQAEDANPSLSKVILKLMLKIGQCSNPDSPLGMEYNNLQFMLRNFYCACGDRGKIKYGPFLKLPKDCQEVAIFCLYYFSSLDSNLLTSLAYCCLVSDHGPEHFILLRIVDVLQSAYKVGRVQIADYIGFLITIVARFKVHHDKFSSSKDHEKVSNWRTFKDVIDAVFSCLTAIGDSSLILNLLQKRIIDEMCLRPALDNMHGMLRMIAVLDSRPSKITEENVITISHFIYLYLIDVTSKIPNVADEDIQLSSIHTAEYYMKPCIFLFYGSSKLLNSVLLLLASSMERRLPITSHSGHDLDLPTKISAVAYVLIIMFKDVKACKSVCLSKETVKDILKNTYNLLISNTNSFTVEEKYKIKYVFDKVKAGAYKAKCLELADLQAFQIDSNFVYASM